MAGTHYFFTVQKLIKHMLNYLLFFLCVYKWLIITKKTYENNDVEVVVDGIDMLWLNEKHIEEKLGHRNLPAITNKYDPVYKKYRYE